MFSFRAKRSEQMRRSVVKKITFLRGTWTGLCFVCLVPMAKTQDLPSRHTVSSQRDKEPMRLTLPEAIAMAMQHNRHMQLAGLAVRDAELKRDVVRSDYYPHIKNESTVSHITALEGIVIPAGAFSVDPLVPSTTKRIGQGGANAYTSGTGLEQPLTQLLKVHAAARAASADVEVSKLEAKDVSDSIALQVHQFYYKVLIARSHLRAISDSVQAGILAEEESKQAVAQGKSLDVAELETRAALLGQKQQSLSEQLSMDDLMMQFDDALGLPLGTKLDLDEDALGDDPVLPTEDESVHILGEHNPKVLSAAQNVEKAKAALRAAKDAYIPNVTGLARYSYQSGVPFLVHNFGTFGGIVSYDLFDGGARQAKLKQAQNELRMAEFQMAQTRSDVSVQVSALYDDIHKLQELLAVTSETLVVRQEQARVTSERSRENAALPSVVAQSNAGIAVAQASVLETKLGLLLLQQQVQVLLGQRPN